ncbi:MAG: asparagine synthetase B [Streptosporangiales bacterium]|nr:asparagine synthetase B [Streptosporangiales bacterium]
MTRLGHRGPDGVGTCEVHDHRLLGHRRLAVIDPRHGQQPLTTPNGDALVANGMIYNDDALRSELGAGKYATGSDSESILHAVRRWGADAPTRLDGMFAFVYATPDRIVAARDPLGIKPLYRVRIGDVDGFSSEVKAFDGIADEVTEFPAGHVFDSAHGLRRYYQVPAGDPVERATAEVVRDFREVLEAAVVKRLRSDVPFGALLSGGLDSSLITALARRHVDELHTFAVGLPDSPDLKAARLVADHLGTIHHELVVEPDDAIKSLPDVIWHLESADVDLVRSAVMTWQVMQFASNWVTVVLTGEGADELFAGYSYHESYDDPVQLHDELRRSLGAMHNINLQRVDRMSMAHGVEARVPFLDKAVIAEAMRIRPELKQYAHGDGEPMEKWVLRAAASDLLPAEIVWRKKAQFDEGTGMSTLLPGAAATESLAEADWYAGLMDKRFKRPEQVHAVAGTWTDDRV